MKTINKIRSKDPDIYNAKKEWFEKARDETDDDDDDGGDGGGCIMFCDRVCRLYIYIWVMVKGYS